MNTMDAYMLMDDPEAYVLMGNDEPEVEDFIAAAKELVKNPALLMTAPGRVGRNVEHVLLTYCDVEEDG